MADSLGTYLRELREASHLSQRAVAQRVGCSNTYISQLEKGAQYPAARFLYKLIEVLRGDFREAWDRYYADLVTIASISSQAAHSEMTSAAGMP